MNKIHLTKLRGIQTGSSNFWKLFHISLETSCYNYGLCCLPWLQFNQVLICPHGPSPFSSSTNWVLYFTPKNKPESVVWLLQLLSSLQVTDYYHTQLLPYRKKIRFYDSGKFSPPKKEMESKGFKTMKLHFLLSSNCILSFPFFFILSFYYQIYCLETWWITEYSKNYLKIFDDYYKK